ncbi:MAG: type II toxin-antitoxin system death-on-curing family toxin [Gemmatimonadales bacterium]
MQEPVWVPPLVVEIAHHGQIQEHGGLPGIRDANALEAALARPQQKWTYDPDADLALLAAAYAYGIATSHPFNDGNKRSALIAMVVLLDLNGYVLTASEVEVVPVILSLAAGELSEAALRGWVAQHMAVREG